MFSHLRKIDLTHTLNAAIPAWENTCGFKCTVALDYSEGCRVQKLEMSAGIGTHMDAPLHFMPDSVDIASIALDKLIIPARVIDTSSHSHPDYLISVEDIIDHEKIYGLIPENNLVIFYTGWSRYWHDAEKYRNEDKNHIKHFPSLSLQAAEILIKRNITGIAIDTLSPDTGRDGFPVHHLLLKYNKYIIENIANADLLPPIGSHIIALPLKIEAGTESAIRMVGLI